MAWRTSTYSPEPKNTTKAIPGYSGYLRNAKDIFGISTGKALAQDALGQHNPPVTLPGGTVPGSVILSPLDTDGAVWDHKYETTSKAMNAYLDNEIAAKNLNVQGPVSIVGYTGHIHMSQEVLGASHSTTTQLSENARAMERERMKSATEETRPHWTSFRVAQQNNPEWRQNFTQMLTTRPNPKKQTQFTEGPMAGEVEGRKAKMLREQVKAAESVLGVTTPTRSLSSSVNRSTKSSSFADEDDQTIPKRIVGYTGHMHGLQGEVGMNFGRLEQKTSPYQLPVGGSHPLGNRYQSAAQSLPKSDVAIRTLVQQPVRPAKTGVPVIDLVKMKVIQRHGRLGIRSLAQMMRRTADCGNSILSHHDFQRRLQQFGLILNQVDNDQLMIHFGADVSGQMSVIQFIHSLQGEMPADRMALVTRAFDLLDGCCGGSISLIKMEKLYDASHHPDVLGGQRSSKEVLDEFLKSWGKAPEEEISYHDFEEYYRDISAGISDGQYFELMLRNTWHISGGEGVCANTSCRRILVIHQDGTETVEEILNDLGISPHDKDLMMQNLEAQGITDIARIRLL